MTLVRRRTSREAPLRTRTARACCRCSQRAARVCGRGSRNTARRHPGPPTAVGKQAAGKRLHGRAVHAVYVIPPLPPPKPPAPDRRRPCRTWMRVVELLEPLRDDRGSALGSPLSVHLKMPHELPGCGRPRPGQPLGPAHQQLPGYTQQVDGDARPERRGERASPRQARAPRRACVAAALSRWAQPWRVLCRWRARLCAARSTLLDRFPRVALPTP